jgi:hypothetical protein
VKWVKEETFLETPLGSEIENEWALTNPLSHLCMHKVSVGTTLEGKDPKSM